MTARANQYVTEIGLAAIVEDVKHLGLSVESARRLRWPLAIERGVPPMSP